MKRNNILLAFLMSAVIYSLTGCYTQVATTDPVPYSTTTTIYKQSPESSDYYSEDGELLDSSYYSEIDPETDDSVTIINNYYYNYPYGYYDYFPSLSFSIGFGWGWGWGSYYAYWPYYPYYYGYGGCGWYYPSYCYYPGYYYYDSYYCNPYYGGYYPNYGYGYYKRDEYVTRVRNNSGGRNSPEQIRDPFITTSTGTVDRSRNDLSLGRDLTVDRKNVSSNSADIRNRTGDLTRNLSNTTTSDRITSTKRNDLAGNDLNRSNNIRNDKQLGLDREVTTKKSLGIDNRNDVSKKISTSNKLGNYTDKMNQNNRITRETKQLFDKQKSTRNNKNNVRSNNNTKESNIRNSTKSNQTPNKNTRSYTPPKQNNTQPRTYSQPKSNNNSPRSYTPPSRNNSPRSNTPPSRSGGSNNSGSRRR